MQPEHKAVQKVEFSNHKNPPSLNLNLDTRWTHCRQLTVVVKMESQEETKEKLLQFLPFSSVVESTFWHKLSELKIDVYALKDEPVDITGYYSNHTAPRLPACLNVDYSSFDRYQSF